MERPNLFEHARSELTQDAFLAWLLSWADPKYESIDPPLHEAGRRFVELLLGRADLTDCPIRGSVTVHTQSHRVDILAEIGDDLVILIEDKVDAGIHGDQLARYSTWADESFTGRTVVSVLLTVGELSSLKAAEEAGWAILRRRDILQLLRRHAPETGNAIFHDFLTHLEQVDSAVRAYSCTPPAEWGWRAWTGFYQELQSRLDSARWEYVPKGDFLALYWGDWAVGESSVYLQLQRSELAVRVSVHPNADRRLLRDGLVAALMGSGESDDLQRPSRLGIGNTMAVAVLPEYRRTGPDGLVDVDATLELLRNTARLVGEKLAGIRP